MRKSLGGGVVVLFASILSACGGGGGGSSSSSLPNDGLGISGQISGVGTVATTATNTSVLITLDDVGRVLAVWVDDSSSISWTSASLSGSWLAPGTLSLAAAPNGFTGVVLRGNAAGNAVLGWSHESNPDPITFVRQTYNQTLRYSPASGWENAVVELTAPSGADLSFSKLDRTSDLALLSDGTMVLGAKGNATTPSGGDVRSVWAVKRGITDSAWTLHESAATSNPDYPFLATTASGQGVMFWTDTLTFPSGPGFKMQGVDIPGSGFYLSPASFFANRYSLCSRHVAATSPTVWRALAILHTTTGASCDLDLVRINSGVISTIPQRMNAAGVQARDPRVVVNQAGDMFAIWEEYNGVRTELFWARAPQTLPFDHAQPWGQPSAAIDSSLMDQMTSGKWTFAANSNGQAVVGALVSKDSRDYILAGRFSSASGWTWQRVANQASMSVPSVAINSNGDAILLYGAAPCDRTERPGAYINCQSRRLYAFRF